MIPATQCLWLDLRVDSPGMGIFLGYSFCFSWRSSSWLSKENISNLCGESVE